MKQLIYLKEKLRRVFTPELWNIKNYYCKASIDCEINAFA